MPGPAITFDAISLTLANTPVLENVSFSVASGEIHCLIGPNGGGKTSLVRALLGQMPQSGTISIAWRHGRTIGYIPQFLDFDKTLPVTVSDFMAMVCQKRRPAFLGLGRGYRRMADAALDRVGLNGKRNAKLGSLSGGERQRVLFAQALIPDPELLVLDEPMTAMDEVGAEIFEKIILEKSAEGTTVFWIAHDLAQVRRVANTVTCLNRTVLFSGSPGEVLAQIETHELFEPSGMPRQRERAGE